MNSPALGPHAEPCSSCGSPLANDQRYCLECGQRRGDARVDFMETLRARMMRDVSPALAGGVDVAEGTTGNLYPWWRSPIAPIGAAAALFVLILGVGVLIGNSGQEAAKPVAATPPQVITVPAATGATAPASAEITSDWPDGQEGYTVQLQTLPKEGTQQAAVDAAKTDATTKGAAEVGALDSDQFASLDAGNIVIYSCVCSTKKEAQTALKKLKADFPDAQVVQVSAVAAAASEAATPDLLSGKKKSGTASDQQLESLQKSSPEDYQKQSQKLPDETKTQGKVPPKDNKDPGGGDSGETIK